MNADAESGALFGMGKTKWDRFLFWAGKYQATPEFDGVERDYKVEIAKRIVEAKDMLLASDSGWIDQLHNAITDKPNNLTNWRQTQPLEAWMRADPAGAGLAFRILWNADHSVQERFNGFAEVVTNAGLSAPISETSFFHMAMGIEEFPIFRATPMDRAMVLTGYPLPKEAGVAAGDIGGRYDHFLRFLDIVMKRAAERGIQFRDRLDAQSATWIVTQWPPHASWSESEQNAFEEYQGDAKSRKASWKQPGTV